MIRALIVGLGWLTLTAAISLVLGRVLMRADARREQEVTGHPRARAAPSAHWAAGAYPITGCGGPVAPPGLISPRGPSGEGTPGKEQGLNCTLARPPRHGHPLRPRPPRGRGEA